MTQQNLILEKDKVDSYLITTNITLLAAFFVIISIDSKALQTNTLTIIALIVSVTGLALSLVFSLWHKYRIALRKIVFDDLKEKAFNKFEKQLEAIETNAAKKVQLIAYKYFLEKKSEKITKEELKKGLEKRFEDERRNEDKTPNPINMAIAENAANNFSQIYTKAFNRPLDEKLAKIKFCMDYTSKRLRYSTFTVGLLAFITSIISKILS